MLRIESLIGPSSSEDSSNEFPICPSSSSPPSSSSLTKTVDFKIAEQLMTQLLTADMLQRIYADQVTAITAVLLDLNQNPHVLNQPGDPSMASSLSDVDEKPLRKKTKKESEKESSMVGKSAKYTNDEARKMANERERLRVQSIGKVLSELRKSLPCDHPRLSKISILRLATLYIAYLGSLLNDQDSEIHKQRFQRAFDFETRNDKRSMNRI